MSAEELRILLSIEREMRIHAGDLHRDAVARAMAAEQLVQKLVEELNQLRLDPRLKETKSE